MSRSAGQTDAEERLPCDSIHARFRKRGNYCGEMEGRNAGSWGGVGVEVTGWRPEGTFWSGRNASCFDLGVLHRFTRM